MLFVNPVEADREKNSNHRASSHMCMVVRAFEYASALKRYLKGFTMQHSPNRWINPATATDETKAAKKITDCSANFINPQSRRVGGFARTRRFVLDNVAGDGAGRHGQRARQIHLPRTAAPGEVSVLRADYHLVGTRGNTRSSVDTSAATRLNHLCACLAEDVEIALAHAVFARLLRSELEIESAVLRNPLALLQGIAERSEERRVGQEC